MDDRRGRHETYPSYSLIFHALRLTPRLYSDLEDRCGEPRANSSTPSFSTQLSERATEQCLLGCPFFPSHYDTHSRSSLGKEAHLGCQFVGQLYVFPVQLFGWENARRRHRGGRKIGFIKVISQICCNVTSLQSRPNYLMPSQPIEPPSLFDPAELSVDFPCNSKTSRHQATAL